MNCWGETDLSSQRLRKMWRDPDLRFDISTPLSRVRIFHPSLAFPNLFESEADNNSCIQLSLANWTYLLRESSLMDLSGAKRKCKKWDKYFDFAKVSFNKDGYIKREGIYQDWLQAAGLLFIFWVPNFDTRPLFHLKETRKWRRDVYQILVIRLDSREQNNAKWAEVIDAYALPEEAPWLKLHLSLSLSLKIDKW